MGDIRPQHLVRRARPILWRRDYDAARALVAKALRSLDDARFLALQGELSKYVMRRPLADAMRVVEWSECVFVPVIGGEGRPLRRWSDTE